MTKSVVVVGSHVQGLFMRVPHFPAPDETVLGWGFKQALDGGKGSHQAIACARLGLSTSFVGRVGNDSLGDIGASWMREAGVDLTYLTRSNTTETGCGFVMINSEGVPAMATAMGANSELSRADIDRARPAIAQAEIVLTTFEIPVDTGLYATRVSKELGAVTILTPAPAELLARDALTSVDVLVPNETEAKVLVGLPVAEVFEPEELASRLHDRYGLRSVVITRGEKGAFVTTAGKSVDVAAVTRVEVADASGAGDAFSAGLAFGLAACGSLVEATKFGCLTGAYAVTARESLPGFGTLVQIASFAKEHASEIELLQQLQQYS